jgi:hypothetical protein
VERHSGTEGRKEGKGEQKAKVAILMSARTQEANISFTNISLHLNNEQLLKKLPEKAF